MGQEVVTDAVSHAVGCRFGHCQHRYCGRINALLLHGSRCEVRVPGGCDLCKKMWILLYLHALPCKQDDCYVPRCRDLKAHMRNKVQAEKDDEVYHKALVGAAISFIC